MTHKRAAAGASGDTIQVLVVDDSATVRQGLGSLLGQEPGFDVNTAADPIIAMRKMETRRPDVIILDLEMPRMDGLTFLKKIMAEDPLPVVICSSLTGEGAEAAVRATRAGAVAIVTKPKLGVQDFLHESAVMFIDTIKGAARANRRARAPGSRAPLQNRLEVVEEVVSARPLGWTTDKIVAVGASTGGTEALRQLLQGMPPDCPGTIVVQHMPELFTAAFAKHLNETSQIEVKEAESGDRVRQGRALIAPGDRHIAVRQNGGQYVVSVTDGPLVSRHRPSVDHLFRSVAQAAGANAVGVIMTGMGDDGAAGLLEMKEAGAQTVAQDEASCVVFGMPKVAIELGAVDDVVPLRNIGPLVLRRIASMESQT